MAPTGTPSWPTATSSRPRSPAWDCSATSASTRSGCRIPLRRRTQDGELVHFDHVGISVSDLDRATRWYTDAMDLHVDFAFAMEQFDFRGVMLISPAGYRIELLERAGSRPGLEAPDPLTAALPGRVVHELDLAVREIRVAEVLAHGHRLQLPHPVGQPGTQPVLVGLVLVDEVAGEVGLGLQAERHVGQLPQRRHAEPDGERLGRGQVGEDRAHRGDDLAGWALKPGVVDQVPVTLRVGGPLPAPVLLQ